MTHDFNSKVSTWAIFCKVIDNFGDIGVVWRLTRNLAAKGITIIIYVDNLEIFKKICPEINPQKEVQYLSKYIKIRKWLKDCSDSSENLNVIIEAFACYIPESIRNTMTTNTIWINLEYLSAEKWIENCHTLSSLQNDGIQKFFFFPGFNNKTGGLNFDDDFTQITHNEAKKAISKLCPSGNIQERFVVLVFTYETKALYPLLSAILHTNENALILLPEGRSTNFLISEKIIEKLTSESSKASFVQFPMICQEKFNYLIKGADLCLVRGEDSITQAVISGNPFMWHIYKQENNVHIDKLQSFLKYQFPSILTISSQSS